LGSQSHSRLATTVLVMLAWLEPAPTQLHHTRRCRCLYRPTLHRWEQHSILQRPATPCAQQCWWPDMRVRDPWLRVCKRHLWLHRYGFCLCVICTSTALDPCTKHSFCVVIGVQITLVFRNCRCGCMRCIPLHQWGWNCVLRRRARPWWIAES
jgi:hypothetical protein